MTPTEFEIWGGDEKLDTKLRYFKKESSDETTRLRSGSVALTMKVRVKICD
ncbi:hypothetical protein XBKB1_980003 [Xenorhabdus bovienii str. kraussei Becker Underwood]|uniref:Uncharacterized protein n=1 Tax=Xenorhabdus bovienii str. kraussei Becker Underwood TaxID=1398204 RepID=A0A077PRA8_XENBV|nr:hypothetical protein XBKB1_980003 [Xenorhabdus bovienii str. kraussei Becker Underwood]